MDISEVISQNHVKRAVEIAIAGNHNLLLIGPQGSGKTMWGEVIKSLFSEREFVFLDNVFEEMERVILYRKLSSSKTPPLLIATSRLCSCGNINHPHHECRCEVDEVVQYRNQMPMWLLRAFDLIIELTLPRYEEFSLDFQGESSQDIKERIGNVALIQEERFGNSDICWNSQMPPRLLKAHCYLKQDSQTLLQLAVKELGLYVGDYLSILRVARTIADLGVFHEIQAEHVAEVIQYSSIDWFKVWRVWYGRESVK
jgi:predicted ATPase with chaperone activity